MGCLCGSEMRPNAPPQFVIYQSDITSLLKLGGLPRSRGKTDNLRDIFENSRLVPVDAFDTSQFCSRPADASYNRNVEFYNSLYLAAYNSLIEDRWNSFCRCKQHCQPPPFKGGQCCNVPYRVEVDVHVTANDGYDQMRTVVSNFVGRLHDVSVIVERNLNYALTSSLTIVHYDGVLCDFEVREVKSSFEVNPRPGITVEQVITAIRVTRQDGAEDVCGDRQPYEPPYWPPPNIFILPPPGLRRPAAIAPPPLPVGGGMRPPFGGGGGDNRDRTKRKPSPPGQPPASYSPPPGSEVLNAPPAAAPPNLAAPPPNGGCVCPPPPPPQTRVIMIQGIPGRDGKDGRNGVDGTVEFVPIEVPVVNCGETGIPSSVTQTVYVPPNKQGQSSAAQTVLLFQELAKLRTEGRIACSIPQDATLLDSLSIRSSVGVLVSTVIPSSVRSIAINVTPIAIGSVRQFVESGIDSEYLLGHVSFMLPDNSMLLPRLELSTLQSSVRVPLLSVPVRLRLSMRLACDIEIYDTGDRG